MSVDIEKDAYSSSLEEFKMLWFLWQNYMLESGLEEIPADLKRLCMDVGNCLAASYKNELELELQKINDVLNIVEEDDDHHRGLAAP